MHGLLSNYSVDLNLERQPDLGTLPNAIPEALFERLPLPRSHMPAFLQRKDLARLYFVAS